MREIELPPVVLDDAPRDDYKGPKGVQPRPVHWLGDDGRNVFLEVQGNFAAVAFRKGPKPEEQPLRDVCKGFSKASRLRLFKKINRLDFARVGRCTFATFTWRDELGRPEPEAITMSRSWCHRSIETLAGHHVCGIWRVEWQLRKSGIMQGQAMPHVHVIYFNVPWLDRKAVTRAWATAIGTTKGVSVKLKEIVNVRQCLYYVSKYVAKLDELDRRDDLGNLDIAAYLNKYLPGRKWGIYRKELFPGADSFEIRIPPGPLVDRLRALAKEAYAGTSELPGTGFCVFGEAAKRIQQEIDQWLLTQPPEMLSCTSQRGEVAEDVR